MKEKYEMSKKGAPERLFLRSINSLLGRGRAAEPAFGFLRKSKKHGRRSLRGRDALFVKVRL